MHEVRGWYSRGRVSRGAAALAREAQQGSAARRRAAPSPARPRGRAHLMASLAFASRAARMCSVTVSFCTCGFSMLVMLKLNCTRRGGGGRKEGVRRACVWGAGGQHAVGARRSEPCKQTPASLRTRLVNLQLVGVDAAALRVARDVGDDALLPASRPAPSSSRHQSQIKTPRHQAALPRWASHTPRERRWGTPARWRGGVGAGQGPRRTQRATATSVAYAGGRARATAPHLDGRRREGGAEDLLQLPPVKVLAHAVDGDAPAQRSGHGQQRRRQRQRRRRQLLDAGPHRQGLRGRAGCA